MSICIYIYIHVYIYKHNMTRHAKALAAAGLVGEGLDKAQRPQFINKGSNSFRQMLGRRSPSVKPP